MTGQLVWLCTCGLPTRNGAGSKCAACRPKKIRRKSSCKAWSDADLRTLRTEWHELSERRLRERFPGRSWLAILHKATELGLPMGVPQGHVSVERAITELGLTRPTFFAICEARSVRVRLQYTDGCTRKTLGRHRAPRRYVDLEEARTALGWWLSTETPQEAARARGLYPGTLRRWLNEAGLVAKVKQGVRQRVVTADVDRVVAERTARAA